MVSIIVPVYNQEEYLRQCVQSVLAQTFHDWELILVDDGSTDESRKICDKAARLTSNIKVIHNASKRGPSAARNRGLDYARGSHITFLDADDLLHPLFLERMMTVMQRKKATVACTRIKRFDDELKLYSSRTYRMPLDTYANHCKIVEFTNTLATASILYQKFLDASVCGKIFEASLWKGERFREGIRYEDLEIMPRILLKSRLTVSYPIEMYYYRQHPVSFIHTFDMRRADVLDVTSGITAYMRHDHPSLLPAAIDRELSANFNIMALMLTHPEATGAAAMADRCWQKIKELRGRDLRNPNIRMKNRVGILASYMGRSALSRLFKLYY